MKKSLIFLLVGLLCFSLCACQEEAPERERAVKESTEATTPTEQTTTQIPETQDTTEPAPVLPEKVTVYLLEKEVLFDSGYTEYTYDKNYNITGSTTYSIENDVMFTTTFSAFDVNGMPCKVETHGENRTMVWFQDGKLKEEQYDGSNFSGVQYEYDQKGDIIEKRSYYDGILETIVYYQYEGDKLSAVYGEDRVGTLQFECLIENGRIVEASYYTDGGYRNVYEYDQQGNLVQDWFVFEGEKTPGTQYSYKAVEVDPSRVPYLLQQQKYLIPIV